MLTIEELQSDVGHILDYLHTTPEDDWNMEEIFVSMMYNMRRFNENIKYYNTPDDVEEYAKLVYSRTDTLGDLIRILTDRHTALGKLTLKEEYKTS